MLNHPVKAALLAALCFAPWAHAGELRLYSQPDFYGRPVTVSGNVANLSAFGFNDRASSMIVQSGRWELCEHVDFGGRCELVGPGEYRNLEQFNNRVSSVREIAGHGRGEQGRWEHERSDQNAGVELFSGRRFHGRSLPLERDSRDLNEFSFNDRAGSVVVYEGSWTFCQDVRYKGRCVTLEPGRYEHLRGMDKQISSLRRVR